MRLFRGGGAGTPREGGGEYLASVSDLMAALFFLVMIVLVVVVGKTLIELKKLDVDRREYQRLNRGIVDARLKRSDFIKHIKDRLQAENVTIEVDENEGVFRFPEKLLFPSGRWELSKDGEEAIVKLGTILAARLPCYSGDRGGEPPTRCDDPALHSPGKFDVLLIEGHTDSAPLPARHNLDSNLQLSAYRSCATYEKLVKAVPLLLELKNAEGKNLLGVSGYGEYRPIRDNDIDDNMSLNRRVDFRVVLAAPPPREEPVAPDASGRGRRAPAPAVPASGDRTPGGPAPEAEAAGPASGGAASDAGARPPVEGAPDSASGSAASEAAAPGEGAAGPASGGVSPPAEVPAGGGR
jgi:hypothetical protein